MASIGDTTRPAFAYDSATDTWIPVGVGPHAHTPAAIGAIASSLVTTKGDLIVATGSGVVVRQGVGANGDTLVADSSTSTGLRYQSAYNGNGVINGGTDIWQRGTSFAVTGTTTFTADRYLSYRSGAVAGMTVTRSTDVPTGFQYSAKIQRDSGNTGTQNMNFRYAMETSDAVRFAGQTVTISFYAKAGANFSSASSNLNTFQYSGTGTNQAAIDMTSWTGLGNTLATGVTLTTSWQRFSVTQTYASTVTQIGLAFVFTPVGTAGADDSFFITGIQVEYGSVATNFKRAGGGTIQGELAACQRYYQRFTGASSTAVLAISGFAASTTIAIFNLIFPVQMRIAPSALDTNNLAFYNFRTAATLSGGTFVRWQGYPSQIQLRYTHGSAVLAINDQIDIVGAAAADTYIGLSAEL
jgi:hypothetical protein